MDQGSTSNFKKDLAHRQNVTRLQTFYSNHQPCSGYKLTVCFARCLFKERNVRCKGLKFSSIRRTFLILFPVYLLEINYLICKKNKTRPLIIQRHIFCICYLLIISEEMFICFVQFWSRRPVSLGCVQGTEFHYAAFKSS